MFINNICSPAIIYLGFSITQIIIDIYKTMYNTAFLKFIVTIVFTLILNIICERGLSIISWIIVFVPFMFITVITSILLYMFGLDPFFGKLKYNVDNLDNKITPILYNNNNNNSLISNNTNEIINNENSHESQLPINRILYNNNKNKNLNNSENLNNSKNLNNNNNNIENCLKSCLEICNNKNTNNSNYCPYHCQSICKKGLYNTIN